MKKILQKSLLGKEFELEKEIKAFTKVKEWKEGKDVRLARGKKISTTLQVMREDLSKARKRFPKNKEVEKLFGKLLYEGKVNKKDWKTYLKIRKKLEKK